jgi:hypothetical protein
VAVVVGLADRLEMLGAHRDVRARVPLRPRCATDHWARDGLPLGFMGLPDPPQDLQRCAAGVDPLAAILMASSHSECVPVQCGADHSAGVPPCRASQRTCTMAHTARSVDGDRPPLHPRHHARPGTSSRRTPTASRRHHRGAGNDVCSEGLAREAGQHSSLLCEKHAGLRHGEGMPPATHVRSGCPWMGERRGIRCLDRPTDQHV